MDPKMRKRIERIEEKVGMSAQIVAVKVWLDDESTADEKIERWKNGEDIDGINCVPYKGGELEVIKIGFVESPLRRDGEIDHE